MDPFSLYEGDHITIKISVHFLRFSLLGAIHERRHQFFWDFLPTLLPNKRYVTYMFGAVHKTCHQFLKIFDPQPFCHHFY